MLSIVATWRLRKLIAFVITKVQEINKVIHLKSNVVTVCINGMWQLRLNFKKFTHRVKIRILTINKSNILLLSCEQKAKKKNGEFWKNCVFCLQRWWCAIRKVWEVWWVQHSSRWSKLTLRGWLANNSTGIENRKEFPFSVQRLKFFFFCQFLL